MKSCYLDYKSAVRCRMACGQWGGGSPPIVEAMHAGLGASGVICHGLGPGSVVRRIRLAGGFISEEDED